MIANGFFLYLTWWYATDKRRLVDKDLDQHTVASARNRILVGPSIFALGIMASFIDTNASVIIYMLAIPYYLRPGHIDIHFRSTEHHDTEHGN